MKQSRPLGITLLSILVTWNGLLASIMGLFLTFSVHDWVQQFYPIPGLLRVSNSFTPTLSRIVLVGLSSTILAAGIGLWKMKNWSRRLVIFWLLVTLIVPSLGAIVSPRAYYGWLSQDSAGPPRLVVFIVPFLFLLIGLWILRYLLVPEIRNRFLVTKMVLETRL